VRDAESQGDGDAAWLFRQSQQHLAQIAQEAKELLANRLQGGAGAPACRPEPQEAKRRRKPVQWDSPAISQTPLTAALQERAAVEQVLPMT
jgi:hypothetical protein